MPTIEEYIDMGFSGIVILESDTEESHSGMQEEVTRQKLACRDRRNDLVELTYVEVMHPLRRTSGQIECREVISLERYAAHVAKHGILDTADFRRKREVRQRAASAAKLELERMVPQCPQCGEAMEVKVNRKRGTRFWGCTTFSWKGCRGCRDISDRTSRRIDALNGIISAAR